MLAGICRPSGRTRHLGLATLGVLLFATAALAQDATPPPDVAYMQPSAGVEAPAHTFDNGSMAFMLVATSLVMLMTPGLAFFYGGLVGRKHTLTIMTQSFVSLGWTTVIWFICGFSLCFSGKMADGTDVAGLIGNLNMAFLHGIDLNTPFSDSISMYVFIAYQMMFAIITPALITGAFANRVRFSAYLIFLTAWLFLVYFPLVHMVWGGGLLAEKFGVLDFAGGIVVHASAGFAALASVFFVGKRRTTDAGPHSIPLVALGTGLLWFGWYGFNAGSELAIDTVTVAAFLNTDIAASFAAIAWLAIAWKLEHKPKFVGLLTGAVAGLATITPAAGFVTPLHAMIIGLAAGAVCYAAVALKNKLHWDDALDVWGVHGVGGCLGVVALGLFASKSVNSMVQTNGLLTGGGMSFFLVQLITVIAVAFYCFAFSYVMLYLINLVAQVKVTPQEEATGLDASLHGEAAYLAD